MNENHIEKKEKFSLISVNYNACEKILKSKRRRDKIEIGIHGKPLNENSKSKKKTKRKENEEEKEKEKKKEKEKEKEKKKEEENEKEKTYKKHKHKYNTKNYNEENIKISVKENIPHDTITENVNLNNAIAQSTEANNATEIQDKIITNSKDDAVKKIEIKAIYIDEPIHNEAYAETQKREYPKEKQNIQKDEIDIKVVGNMSKNDFWGKWKSHIYNDEKYNTFVGKLKQQRLEKFNKIYNFYKWKTAAGLLFLCSILLFLIGIFIYKDTQNVVETVISYNTGENHKIFTIKQKMHKPVYVYYKISNYYANYKGYLSDQSTSFVSEYKCKYVKTFEDLYKYRCINGKQTLPELHQRFKMNDQKVNIHNKNNLTDNSDNKISHYSPKGSFMDTCDVDLLDPQLKKENIFPCGLISASIFNDKIDLSINGKSILIENLNAVNNFDFFTYAKKKKEGEKYKEWFNTYSTEYRNWSHNPMTSSFIKLYGIIDEDLSVGSNYKLSFLQNTWPAEKWNAQKAFVLVSLTVLGNDSVKLAYLYFLTAIIYIIIVILILLLVKFKYYKLGKTFSFCEVSSGFDHHQVDLLSKISSKRQPNNLVHDQTKPNILKTPNSFDFNSDVPLKLSNIEKISCICPLH